MDYRVSQRPAAFYLFYPRPGRQGEHRAAIVLPQILTAATILHETQIC
jgi:hypothetical protein